MDKEEILARSRNEKADEGKVAAENQGRKLGVAIVSCVFAFITLFDILVAKQTSDAAYGIYWAFIAAESYPKYKFTSRRRYLVLMLFGTLMGSLCLLSYVLEGWR